MIRSAIIVVLVSSFFSCSSNSIKENINKAGDAAGQAAGEFVEGATKGVTNAFDVKIDVNPSLIGKGIAFGKTTVSDDTTGTDNLLVAYVIFNKDFKGELTAKSFDQNSGEMGRASAKIEGKKNEAKYVDFHFDPRTNLDAKNKITIE